MATRSTPAQSQTCKYPGCTRPRYKEHYGLVHEFCGRTHAQQYAELELYKKTLSPPPTYSRTTTRTQVPVSTSASTRSRLQPLKALHKLVKSNDEIKFYNRFDPYYEFTNFYPAFIEVDGKFWPTSEHYFQAQKFVGTPYLEKIRKLPSAREAFQFSRDPAVSQWRRSDWDQVKEDIMLKALRCKFEQDEKLRSLLLGTGDKKLIEHTSNDSYWGNGGGTGLNRLGVLLMQVREELKSIHGSSKTPKEEPRKVRLKRSNSLSNLSTKSKQKSKVEVSPRDDSSLQYSAATVSSSRSKLTSRLFPLHKPSAGSSAQATSVVVRTQSTPGSYCSSRPSRPLPKFPGNSNRPTTSPSHDSSRVKNALTWC